MATSEKFNPLASDMPGNMESFYVSDEEFKVIRFEIASRDGCRMKTIERSTFYVGSQSFMLKYCHEEHGNIILSSMIATI